jgi:hypothetical protein
LHKGVRVRVVAVDERAADVEDQAFDGQKKRAPVTGS